MWPPQRAYDPACKLLAEHFLADDENIGSTYHAARVDSLAMEIQLAIEAWCDAHSDADAGDPST
jgi:hypothetical protein